METKLQTFPSITFIKAMIITVHIRNSLKVSEENDSA